MSDNVLFRVYADNLVNFSLSLPPPPSLSPPPYLCPSFPIFQVEEVEVLVADTSGENVDNKTRLELLKKQEQLIQEEEEEKEKEVSSMLTA